MAEEEVLKTSQCGFDPHPGHARAGARVGARAGAGSQTADVHPEETSFLLPGVTFFIGLLVLALLIVAGVWLLVRSLDRRSVADELGKLARLRDRGVLTESEFARQKANLLHESPEPGRLSPRRPR